MKWVQVSLDELEISGVTQQEFDEIWAPHMQLWRPTDLPEGREYFKLTKLSLNKGGTMNIYANLLTDQGAPVQHCAMAEGWSGGDPLPDDSIPFGGDPRNYPNKGIVRFSDERGVCQWTWGPGEWCAPESEECPHWFWVPAGPGELLTDVIYGLGMRMGTDHYKLDLHWVRVTTEDEIPPTPEPDDLADAVLYLGDQIRAGLEALAAAVVPCPPDTWPQLEESLARIEDLLRDIAGE